MASHWNTTITARLVVEACAARGIDVEPILRLADISAEVLEDPDARVSLEQMSTFWQEAARQSGDPAIGLHAAMVAPRGAYKMFDYLMTYSSTIGESLDRFGRYVSLINSWVVCSTEVDPQHGRLVIDTVWGGIPRTSAEYVFGILVARSRRVWNMEWAPQVVRFQFPPPQPPEPPDEHRRVLGCAIEFNAPRSEVELTRETWDHPVENADPGLIRVLEEQAERILGQMPQASDLVAAVRRDISGRLASEKASVESTAKRMGIAGRTLQRRLAEEGLSFAQIADRVRFQTAKERLADRSLALVEVAYLLGFEEQSSFSRAFKRWTGVSPRDYRKELKRSGTGFSWN